LIFRSLFSWLKESDFPTNEKIEEENYELNCRLINFYNQKRNDDLKNIQISNQFRENFLKELNKVEQDKPKSTSLLNSISTSFLETRTFRYSLSVSFAILIVWIFVTNDFLFTNTINDTNRQSKFDTNMEKMVFEDEYLDELELLADIKKTGFEIDILEKLEEHYKNSGNQEMAERIHTRLEMVAK
jgi:hypothetical protein